MGCHLFQGRRAVNSHWCTGRDVFGAGYEGVLAEMLVQGNNYAHVRPRRLVWLQAAQPLLEVGMRLRLG